MLLPHVTSEDADHVHEIMEKLSVPGTAIAVDWTFERYLTSSDFTSRSALEDLRNEGASYYYAKHIARTIPDKRTPSMQFGSHVHLAVLEPDVWSERLYPQKPIRPHGADGKAKKDSEEKRLYIQWKSEVEAWEESQRRDSIVLDHESIAEIEAIAASVRSHPTCAWAFRANGANEQTILWHHEETGILLRCRLDRLLWYDARTAVIADLKTTNDPSPDGFSKSIANFGYHRQAAFYLDAVQALRPGAELHYELIAVRSSPPYETACYSLSEEPPSENGSPRGAIELGRAQYLETLRELARRRASGDWLAEWQRQSVPITLPDWAFPKVR